MSYHFGAGNLYALNSVNGLPSGVKFGTLQEFSLDFSFNQKELYGQNSFPVTVARGQGKITGKGKSASIVAALWNQVFFGQTSASGQTVAVVGESGLADSSVFTTLANQATLVEILSVTYADTGQALRRVASGQGNSQPVGTWARDTVTGNLQWATADNLRRVLVDYTYTVTTGTTLQLANQQTGVAPGFALIAQLPYQGKQALLRLNQVYAPKLAFGTKLEDFVVPEFDFMVAADAAGQIGIISLPD